MSNSNSKIRMYDWTTSGVLMLQGRVCPLCRNDCMKDSEDGLRRWSQKMVSEDGGSSCIDELRLGLA